MLYNIIQRRGLGEGQSHLGGRNLTWGRRVPEATDKIAVYRVKVFLFELF